MATSYTAVWSAVAASFSALTAFLVMLIQRRNLIESVRPDLIPIDWTRSMRGEGESRHEVIMFGKLRNVGRGAAFNVWVGSKRNIETGERPETIHPTMRIAVIAANETINVNSEIDIWWKNIEEKNGSKYCHIKVNIDYADARDIRYSTEFLAFALPLDVPGGLNDDLAPNMAWTSRNTDRKPIWRLKVVSRLKMAWQSIQRRSRPNRKSQ